DLNAGKVIKSNPKNHKPARERHFPPAWAWRQQTDLMAAMSGIAEAPETRDVVTEAMWTHYQQKSRRIDPSAVYTLALYICVSRMGHWLPAFAKDSWTEAVAEEGKGTPSEEQDCRLAYSFAKKFK